MQLQNFKKKLTVIQVIQFTRTLMQNTQNKTKKLIASYKGLENVT